MCSAFINVMKPKNLEVFSNALNGQKLALSGECQFETGYKSKYKDKTELRDNSKKRSPI